ncbi:MAG TPA: hypothetical protein VGO55_06180, partial [Allosphingosinicella sp.]|nr:hypothetical protein [Allosphingosinicella sp.]
FSFDISPIKHLIYPHSLRFKDIVRFKEEIRSAIVATVANVDDPNSRGYLQQFGPIEIAELGSQLISPEQIVGDLQEIKRSIRALESRGGSRPAVRNHYTAVAHYIQIEGDREDYAQILSELLALESVSKVERITVGGNEHLMIVPDEKSGRDKMMIEIRPLKEKYGLAP